MNPKQLLIVLLALFLATVVILGCTTAPQPPIAGDLTKRDIETAMADAMMVTAAQLFRIALNEEYQTPEGTITEETLVVSWTGMDLSKTLGTITLELDNHLMSSSLFNDDYRDYRFTGTASMAMYGDTAEVFMDLTLSHALPDRYPVNRLELELSGLGDTIRPEEAEGFIRANGYDVDVPTVVRSLQVGD